jgi:hypothetical protein
MEIWFRMQGSTWFHYKRLFNGVSTWFRLFLDGLTNGHFATGDPSFAKYTLMSLFRNHGKTKEEIKLQKLKEKLEKGSNKFTRCH